MNKIDTLFSEYAREMYPSRVRGQDKRVYTDDKFLFCRTILDTSQIEDLKGKIKAVFRNKPYEAEKPKTVKLNDRRYGLAPGQKLYYGSVKEQSGQTFYTVEIFPWRPFSESEKAKMRRTGVFDKFPESPVTVVFRKILP